MILPLSGRILYLVHSQPLSFSIFKEILDQLNQGRVAKMAQLEEEIKLQESVEPMLKVGKDVFEILRVCTFVMTMTEISGLL